MLGTAHSQAARYAAPEPQGTIMVPSKTQKNAVVAEKGVALWKLTVSMPHKADSPMEVTVAGISKRCMDEQPENASAPIDVTEVGKTTFVKALQF